jgi:hypothetical protein
MIELLQVVFSRTAIGTGGAISSVLTANLMTPAAD